MAPDHTSTRRTGCFRSGSSGRGKSTLLRIVAGLLKHTSGSARLARPGGDRRADEARIVFQSPARRRRRADPPLNVLLQLKPRHPHPKPSSAAVTKPLAQVGLGEFHHRLVRAQPSGGMRQRAAIARAQLHRSAVAADGRSDFVAPPPPLVSRCASTLKNSLWMQTGKTVLFIAAFDRPGRSARSTGRI